MFQYNENSEFYGVNWNYQALFEWEQTFKPGPTKVDISYRPIVGDPSDYGDYYDKGEGMKRFCVDPAIRTAIRKVGGRYEVARLGYVLKTARFWNGPIGKFRVVVDKGKPDNLVAFCPASAKKIAPTRFEWTATNFTPERDLEVVFFLRGEDRRIDAAHGSARPGRHADRKLGAGREFVAADATGVECDLDRLIRAVVGC